MRKWIRVCAVVAAAAAVATIFIFLSSWRHSRQVVAAATAGAGAPLADTDQVAELRMKVERLEGQSRRPSLVVLAPGAAAAGARAEVGPEDPAVEEEKLREQARATAQALDARYASEGVDAEWSRKTVRALAESIAAQDARAHLARVECATTLCRVVVDHDSAQAQSDLAAAVSGLDAFRSGVIFDYAEDAAAPRTTMYVLREGTDLRAALKVL